MTSTIVTALWAAPGNLQAVSDEHRSLSYAQLADAVDAEAAWFTQLQTRRCALLADNSTGWVLYGDRKSVV